MEKLTCVRAHYWVDRDILKAAIVDTDRNVHLTEFPHLDGPKTLAGKLFPITPTQRFMLRDGKLISLGEYTELLNYPGETDADIDAEVRAYAGELCVTLVPNKQPHRPLQASSVHWVAHTKYGLLAYVFDQKQRLISCRFQYADGSNIKPEDAKDEAKKLAADFRRGSRFRLVKRRGHLVIDDRKIPLWQIEWLNRANDEAPERDFDHERATLSSRIDDVSEVLFFASGFSLRAV